MYIQEKTYSEDELKNKIVEELEKDLLEQIKNNNQVEDVNSIITDKQVIVKNGTEFMEVELVYEVLENIGVEEKINEEI